MRISGRMVVEAVQDGMGNAHARPIAFYWRKRFSEAAKAANETFNARLNTDGSVFFREGLPAAMFRVNHMPKRYWRDFEHGWCVRFLVDPWVYAHWLGWDVPDNF